MRVTLGVPLAHPKTGEASPALQFPIIHYSIFIIHLILPPYWTVEDACPYKWMGDTHGVPLTL
jgi:hypothetical protein